MRRWNAWDCRKMELFGLLEPGTSELLDGNVVAKPERSVAHSIANLRTLFALSLIFGQDHVMMPVSIVIDEENRPEPDVFVTVRPNRDYLIRGNPTHADMRLIVGVSDTTFWRDRNTKARLYGSAGVPAYWVLDVNGRRLFVHRQPGPEGYTDVKEYDEAQSIASLAAPDQSLLIGDLLP